MKTSLKWMNEYVSIPWSIDKYVNELTLAGLESESIYNTIDLPETIVVAKILSRTKHPNADTLSLCQVDDGSGTPVNVVCGAPNCDRGCHAAFAKVGTRMPGGLKLGKVKIRGEVSFGMLCSEDELGLGCDKSGILILPETARIGLPVIDFYSNDTVIEWEVTPNRPDWLSHLGIARETAVLLQSKVTFPEANLKPNNDRHIKDHFSAEVKNKHLCPRYTVRIIENVTVAPSPDWMQAYLKSVGLRPINNIVDITNFVLMECGQPLHAFDLSKLSGQKIVVRAAHEKEVLTTLDNQKLTLNSQNLVIADNAKNLALAGIIGGDNSEISEKTTDVLLESACFNPLNVRATSKLFGVSTDSSHRFERGVDIEMVEFASARAAHLICKYAGGRLMDGIIDIYENRYVSPEIECRFAKVNKLLGVDIEQSQIVSILKRLGLDLIDENNSRCVVGVPSYRLDLTREADLIEEVARIFGLNNIPASISSVGTPAPVENDSYYDLQQVRDTLIALGLNECMNYTLVSEHDATCNTGFDIDDLVKLSNPLSSELTTLRTSLMNNMLKTISHNIAHDNTTLRLFEIGRRFTRSASNNEEETEAIIVLSGLKNPGRFSEEKKQSYDFYDMKGMIDDFLESRGFDNVKIENVHYPLFYSGVSAQIKLKKKAIGYLGEVNTEIFKELRIKYPIFAAILNIDQLSNTKVNPPEYKSLPQYPAISRDVAFAADKDLTHQEVIRVINSVNEKYLEKIELNEIFADETVVGKGKKSMAYTLTFRSRSKTLTDNEVNQSQEKIRLTLLNKLSIKIR